MQTRGERNVNESERKGKESKGKERKGIHRKLRARRRKPDCPMLDNSRPYYGGEVWKKGREGRERGRVVELDGRGAYFPSVSS